MLSRSGAKARGLLVLDVAAEAAAHKAHLYYGIESQMHHARPFRFRNALFREPLHEAVQVRHVRP
jgi:hypothetical protein